MNTEDLLSAAGKSALPTIAESDPTEMSTKGRMIDISD
jgi:hypothetical protein